MNREPDPFRSLFDLFCHFGVIHGLAFHSLETYIASQLKAVGVAQGFGQHANLHRLLDASIGG
jgi:hypothetical protein